MLQCTPSKNKKPETTNGVHGHIVSTKARSMGEQSLKGQQATGRAGQGGCRSRSAPAGPGTWRTAACTAPTARTGTVCGRPSHAVALPSPGRLPPLYPPGNSHCESFKFGNGVAVENARHRSVFRFNPSISPLAVTGRVCQTITKVAKISGC